VANVRRQASNSRVRGDKGDLSQQRTLYDVHEKVDVVPENFSKVGGGTA